jgi:hypothetical protein
MAEYQFRNIRWIIVPYYKQSHSLLIFRGPDNRHIRRTDSFGFFPLLNDFSV